MALVVNTNISSLIAQKNLGASQSDLSSAMERLSSGSRINSASDDAAGLAIAARMESQVRGLNQAVRNANDGISLVQTAEGAMEEITSMLQRMRELSVQASNGVLNSDDRAAISSEFNALMNEIDRVAENTTFNGQSILAGGFSSGIQVGSLAGEKINVGIANMGTSSLGSKTGVGGAQAVKDATFEGVAAKATVSQLTFNSNDTYEFALTIGGIGTGTNKEFTYNIKADVTGGSAKDVVDKINAALRAAPALGTAGGTSTTATGQVVVPSAADSIQATYNGNSITLKNLAGGLVKVQAGKYTGASLGGNLSASGSTMSFTSIAGSSVGGATLDVKTIGSNAFKATEMINNGPVASSTTGGTTANPAVMNLNFIGNPATETVVTAFTSGDRIALKLAAENGTSVTLDTGTIDATAVTTVADIVAELQAALTSTGNTDYQIAANTATTGNTGDFTITRADGVDFTVTLLDDSVMTGGAAVATDLAEASIDLVGATTNKIYTTDNEVTLTFDALPAAFAGGTHYMEFTIEDEDGASLEINTGAVTGATPTQANVVSAINDALANANAGGATATSGYKVTADGTHGFKIENMSGKEFSIRLTDSSFANTPKLTEDLADRKLTESGGTPATQTQTTMMGTLAVSGTTVTPESKSIMYLTLLGNDTYTFKGAQLTGSTVNSSSKTTGLTVAYDGTSSSLATIAAQLEGELNTLTGGYDFDVVVEDGRLKVTENGGKKFAIADFASQGAGRVAASVPSGQNVSSTPASVLLDDDTYASSAQTDGAGGVQATVVNLEFSADDTYSFTISDGTTTAVVTPTEVDVSGTGTDILAQVNVALRAAGLDDTITATSAASADSLAQVTLSHNLGSKVTVASFASVGNGVVKAEAGNSNVAGVTKFLDDNGGVGAAATISGASVSSDSNAATAIDLLDNAISQVAAERGELGAIQNRLTHTINNLTNISVNTSAAQSRIEDADYAVEAANLAKAQIMQQAGTAMLAQANAMQQTVLSLLQ